MAARALIQAADQPDTNALRDFEEHTRECLQLSGMSIFAPAEGLDLSPEIFRELARALLRPRPEAPMEMLYFETMPASWLGYAYQHMLAFRPARSGDGLELDRSGRKRRGVYFTPPCLVTYIIESVLAPLTEPLTGTLVSQANDERLAGLKVLDPAMGSGDFLSCAVEFLSASAALSGSESPAEFRARVAANCIYGVDVDPTAVDIARFSAWSASLYADGVSDAINSHLVCANALGVSGQEGSEPFDWRNAFPEAFGGPEPGFDALVGNPPYIASKNGLGPARASTRGQSDFYLMFLLTAIENSLVKPGGLLSMVLPDPMLVRENAARIRRELTTDWTIVSLLHISGIFTDAQVANVVPVCRNARPASPTFQASRIERAADRQSFVQRPRKTCTQLARPVRREVIAVQDRCEFLYLLEQGGFGDIVRRIHGDNACLSVYQPPFAPLKSLNVRAIYRGEEIGKRSINREVGELPILLGGQSVQPYEIAWEGRRTDPSRVKKPLERYMSSKILLQKSSARLVAALDEASRKHLGYVFPQSVYAVELTTPGVHELYLLCILNSRVMNEYIWRRVTGYKLLQPQLELEDIRSLPIRRISFTTPPVERQAEVLQAVRLFEDESLRTLGSAPFPELANVVVQCLTGSPEKSDVVHDLLVHLGRLVVDLTKVSRESPDPDTTRRLEAARAAVEAVVWQLYSSQPTQLSLPW